MHLNSLLSLGNYEDDKALFKQVEQELEQRSKALILVFDNAQQFPAAVCQFIESWLKRAEQKSYAIHFVFIFDRENEIVSQAQISLQALAKTHEFEGLKRQEALMYLRQHCQQCGNKQLLSFEASDQIIKLAEGNFASLDKIARSAVAQAYTDKSKQVLAKHVGVKAERMLALQDKGVSEGKRALPIRLILLTLLLLASLLAFFYYLEQNPSAAPQAKVENKVLESLTQVEPETAPNEPELEHKPELPPLIHTLETNRQLAFSAISHRWQLGSLVGFSKQQACSRLAALGLQCVDFNADIESALALNLPLLIKLKLDDEQQPERYGALLAMASQQVWLSVEGELISMPIARLQQFWNGDFSLVWRNRFDLAARLEVGDVDASMAQIRTLLLRWSQLPQHKGKTTQRLKALVRAVDGNRYSQDDALLVQAFQRHYQLPMSGLIEPYMVLLLSQIIEPAEVSLTTTDVAKDLR